MKNPLLTEIIESFIVKSTGIEKSAFPSSTWEAMVNKYIELMDRDYEDADIAKLLVLPEAIRVTAIHDLLSKSGDAPSSATTGSSKRRNGRSLPEDKQGPEQANFELTAPPASVEKSSEKKAAKKKVQLEQEGKVKTASKTKQVKLTKISNSHEEQLPVSTVVKLDENDEFSGRTFIDGEVIDFVESPSLLNQLTVNEVNELSEQLSDKGILSNHSKFPLNIQSHPYAVLRIPLFIAERKIISRTDISEESVGIEYRKLMELNGYEGFESVSIEGPSMNSSHFLVWNAIVRCFRETPKSDIIKNNGVITIKINKFLDYIGVPTKYKNRAKKRDVEGVIADIQKQKMIIGRRVNKVEKDESIKQSRLSLIIDYIFDEDKDEIKISAGSAFFRLFQDYQLVPVDTDFIQSFSHEAEKIAVIFLTALPTHGNKFLALERIMARVKPHKKATARDYQVIKNMMNTLMAQGRIKFELDTSSGEVVYKNFSHSLQRPESEVKKVTLELPRKPRATTKKNDREYDARYKTWCEDAIRTLHEYQSSSGDLLMTKIPIGRIELLIEACRMISDVSTQKYLEKVIKDRREKKHWLSTKLK